MRIASRFCYYTIIILMLLLFHLPTQAQKAVKIDEKTFKTVIKEDKLLLLHGKDQMELASGENWFFSEVFFGLETSIIDTPRYPEVRNLPDPNGVKAIKLSRHKYLLLLSFYGAPSDARVARGLDIFLVYHSNNKHFRTVSSDLMPHIGRGAGPCRNAAMASYLLQDINEDGLLDIGVLRERIKCDFENDAPSRPYYEQQPIKWYVNIKNDLLKTHDYWIPTRSYEGTLPEYYTELSSLSTSPVDVVGSNLWRTLNRLEWPNKMGDGAIVLTNNQKDKVITATKNAKNDSHMNKVSSYYYERRKPITLSYDWADIVVKGLHEIIDSLDFLPSITLTSKDYGNFDHYKYQAENYNIHQQVFYDYELGISIPTQGNFKEAALNFEINLSTYDWVQGEALIHFDQNLDLKKPIEIKRMPDFIMEGKPYNYLTKEQALEASVQHSSILEQPFLKLAEIKRNKEQQPDYLWQVKKYNRYLRDSAYVCFVKEIILLDPMTGELILKKEPTQTESFIDCPDQ